MNRKSSALISDISIHPGQTVRDAMKAINRGTIGITLVIEEKTGKFIGVLTDGDIRRALLEGIGMEAAISKVAHPSSLTAPIGTPRENIRKLAGVGIRVIPLLDEHGRVADFEFFTAPGRLSMAEPDLRGLELEYVTECVLTGWVSSAGKFVGQFEKLVAEAANVEYAIATSNGTTALHLSLAALGIGPGDEVIVPTLSFIATANAVAYTGAKPIFVDVDPHHWTISLEKIEQALTSKTKAIIPVHLYGHPADMDPINELAKSRGIFVVEDAAEAQGSNYKGRPVGSLGHCAMFSFFGNKVVTTGEGGMLLTNDRALAERARILRDHGMSPQRRYWHVELGYNYRMTNLQAAIGVAQMERFSDIVGSKRKIAALYAQALSAKTGLTAQHTAEWAESVYWLYSLVVNESRFGMGRDRLIAILQEMDIETRPLFPCMHLQPIYSTGQRLEVAEQLSAQGLSLPGSTLLQDSDIRRITQAILGAGEFQK